MSQPSDKQLDCISWINKNLGLNFCPKDAEDAWEFINNNLEESKRKRRSVCMSHTSYRNRFFCDHEDENTYLPDYGYFC